MPSPQLNVQVMEIYLHSAVLYSLYCAVKGVQPELRGISNGIKLLESTRGNSLRLVQA